MPEFLRKCVKLTRMPPRTPMKTTARSSGRPDTSRRASHRRRLAPLREFCGVMGVLVPACCAHAFEPADLFAFSAGPVILKPSFGVVTTYSDNLYSLPSDSPLEDLGLIASKDDFSAVLSPGIRARLGRSDAQNWVDFGYRFDQYLYVSNTDSDSPNHSFDLGAAVGGSRLSYDCRNSVQILSSIMSGYEATLNGIVVPPGNVDRTIYSFGHHLAYDLTTKSRLHADGSWSVRDYAGGGLDGARFLDSSDWSAGGGYDYAITEKVRLGAVFGYGQQEQRSNSSLRPDPPTVDSFNVSATASGSFTPKLSGNVRVGYQHRDRYGGNLTASLGVTQQFSEKTSMSLDYSRFGALGSSSGVGMVTDSVGLGVQQAVGARRPVLLSAGVRYVHNAYTDSDLTLNNFDVTVGARRQLTRWASAFLNYSFEISERSTYEYQVNQVSLGINFGL